MALLCYCFKIKKSQISSNWYDNVVVFLFFLKIVAVTVYRSSLRGGLLGLPPNSRLNVSR